MVYKISDHEKGNCSVGITGQCCSCFCYYTKESNQTKSGEENREEMHLSQQLYEQDVNQQDIVKPG